MKKHIKIIIIFLSGYCSLALANDDFTITTDLTKNCKPLINKNLKIDNPPVKGLSEKVNSSMTRAMEYYLKDEYQKAIEIFEAILGKYKEHNIQAMVNKLLAFAYVSNNDVDKAYAAFNRAITYGQLSQEHESNQALRYTAAGYFFSNDFLNKSVQILEEWLKKSNKENIDVYVMLSAIYSDKTIGRNQDAICTAFAGLKMKEIADINLYQIFRNSHLELKDYVGTKKITEKMIELFPDDKSLIAQLKKLEILSFKTTLNVNGK